MGEMRRRIAFLPAFALLTICGFWVAGCGADRSTGSGETTESREPGKERPAEYPKGPTREFIVPGGDNWVQEFGREATARERNQISADVVVWLRARVKGEWTAACSQMTRKARAFAIEAASYYGGDYRTCAGAFGFLTRRSPAQARNNIRDGVASLRIWAGEGYAQYHGKEGRDWILAVHREDGQWKIENLYPGDRLK